MIKDDQKTAVQAPSDADPGGSGKTLSKTKTASRLNELIVTCKDGEAGYRSASEGVKSAELKALFAECTIQRAQFVGELQSLVRSLGGNPEHTGSFIAKLHRGWIDIKAAIEGRDEAGVLVECERGENIAKNAYKTVLKETLRPHVRAVVERQLGTITEVHKQIRSLKTAFLAKDKRHLPPPPRQTKSIGTQP